MLLLLAVVAYPTRSGHTAAGSAHRRSLGGAGLALRGGQKGQAGRELGDGGVPLGEQTGKLCGRGDGGLAASILQYFDHGLRGGWGEGAASLMDTGETTEGGTEGEEGQEGGDQAPCPHGGGDASNGGGHCMECEVMAFLQVCFQ